MAAQKNIPKPLRIAIFSFIVLLVAVLLSYWWYGDRHPETDDAYIGAHVVQVGAEVSGKIVQVYVHDHAMVSRGKILLEIDPKSFQLAVAAAKAKLDLAYQNLGALTQAVSTAEANLNKAKTAVHLAEKTAKRQLTLVSQKQLPAEIGDQAIANVESAKAAYAAAQSQLASAKHQLGMIGSKNASVRAARAALDEAKLNLSHCTIRAAAEGIVENFALRPGTMVTSGQPLFALVESQDFWVDANYKETQLKRIQVGDPASIELDMYPGVTFQGKVEAISAGSGSVFSLLPPENATGNWVKVTQRFPVRIQIEHPDKHYPLRIGSTATVTVNTVAEK